MEELQVLFTHVGRKAGYLGSAYFCGNFAGSLLWGWIADRIGRRPVLLFGVVAILACELLFGFSQNFVWAIVARCLWGILNGNVGVVKTYISEVH
jgi:MFS family permease